MKRIYLLGVASLVFISTAIAHNGASGIVKERMDKMGEISKATKLIGNMLKSSDLDANAIKQAATKIQQHAVHVPKMFPEGRTKSPSEAAPTIWTDWEAFVISARKMGEEAGRLAELSVEPLDRKTLSLQFRELGYTCSSCHEKFRIKK